MCSRTPDLIDLTIVDRLRSDLGYAYFTEHMQAFPEDVKLSFLSLKCAELHIAYRALDRLSYDTELLGLEKLVF